MHTPGLFVSVYLLCAMLFFAIKFIVVLPRNTPVSEEAQRLSYLALTWLVLVFAQCAALLAACGLEIIYGSNADGALLSWALTNQVVASLLAADYLKMPAKMQRALLQYIIAAHGVLLLAWAVSFAVPAVSRTMPGDLTVALSILTVISCGILWFFIPLRAAKPRAVEPKA